METILEKLSSYNIFNNLLPGVVFCTLLEKITRFSLIKNQVFENLFMYYLIGMIISRVGSVFIEKIFFSLKFRNKSFIEFSDHKEYIEASKIDSLIEILNETNNTYRTMIAVFFLIIVIKLYDWLLYDFFSSYKQINNMIFLGLCLLIMILFIFSYKKQTAYIKKRVGKAIESQNKNENLKNINEESEEKNEE